jgi:hypothetical protein
MAEWAEGKSEIEDPYNGDPESVASCFESLDAICRTISGKKM